VILVLETAPMQVPGRRPTSDEEARHQVSLGCRIIARFGHEDLTLGHVSVRGPDHQTIFIKRKGVALSEVLATDVLGVDVEDPDGLSGDGMHLEAVMHMESYRARADVGAIIHSHSLYAVALGATKNPALQFLSHDALLFREGMGLFDETAHLITTLEQGKAVAEALGQRRVVLLKNHGVLIVGEDIRWAVLAAITLDRAIRLQIAARSIGPVEPLSQRFADEIFEEKYQDHFLDEYWDAWGRQLRGEAE
jgi:L-fuculose-phosphate aldolase